MKTLFTIFFTFLTLTSFAQTHPAHHAKHGFFLYGEETLYASHIVYKVPHNYQVILKIVDDAVLTQAFNDAKLQYPTDKLIFVFDPMDLSLIESKPLIRGALYHEDSEGTRHLISKPIELSSISYGVLFFNELPTSL